MIHIPDLYCAPHIYQSAVAGIEYTESAGDPWIATDTYSLRTYKWKTEKEAWAGITNLIKAGHHLAVGIAQIKVSNFKRYHVRLSTALDPCGAARAVANALRLNYLWAEGRGYTGIGILEAAASGYTSGHLRPRTAQTTAYVQRVVYIAQEVSYQTRSNS